jgi:hypothetical protein
MQQHFAGTITHPSYAIYGGLGTLIFFFLKADEDDQIQLTSYATLTCKCYKYNNFTIARFKPGGGLEISQITESAGIHLLVVVAAIQIN